MFVTYHTSAIILNGTSDKTPSIAQHAYSRTVIVTVRRIRTGFLDDMSDSLNSTLIRGSAVAQRTGRIVRIKSDLSDLKHNRVAAVQQLGNKLYPFVANHPDLMATAGEEVRTIAGIDNQIAALEAELALIEEEARLAHNQNTMRTGPAAPTSTPGSLFCPACGAAVARNYRFCITCGAKPPES